MMIVTTAKGAQELLSEVSYDQFIREHDLDPEQQPDEEVAIDRLDLARYNAREGGDTCESS
ncbi:hypothetical protein [Thioalkalivibrio sp. ALE19]|uniref:hypothetical protein n=1 Tax=Thioalkalivibrio sp. ALE19 TaxID=1266909 RepID=UPI00040D60E7|nr:hypothetical protein [Thioalkalivibrio sp. ALE19]